MTKEEYIANKAKDIAQKALEKARNRTTLTFPIVGYTIQEDPKEIQLRDAKMRFDQLEDSIKQGKNLPLDSWDRLATYGDNYYKLKQDKQTNHWQHTRTPKYGFNCIWTVTSDYNRPVSGNYTFKERHKDKGFKRIPVDSILPGDIVQFGLTHAMMANTPYTKNINDMRYNGSNGSQIRIDSKYPANS